jgi:hypothetical protein
VKTYLHLHHWSLNVAHCVCCEVRGEEEETVCDPNITTESDFVLCEVRAEAEETVDDQKITIGHVRV